MLSLINPRCHDYNNMSLNQPPAAANIHRRLVLFMVTIQETADSHTQVDDLDIILSRLL